MFSINNMIIDISKAIILFNIVVEFICFLGTSPPTLTGPLSENTLMKVSAQCVGTGH